MADEEAAAAGDGEAGAHPASTLPRLFLRAMRTHHRSAALLYRDGERWREVPDWRFERQVIRLALFLRDRAALAPGDHLVIVSSRATAPCNASSSTSRTRSDGSVASGQTCRRCRATRHTLPDR